MPVREDLARQEVRAAAGWWKVHLEIQRDDSADESQEILDVGNVGFYSSQKKNVGFY
jgi:hypothetical protein